MAAKNIGKSFLNQELKKLKKNPGRVNITSLAGDYLSLMDQNHVYEDAESFLANLYQVSIVRYFPQNFELNEKYDSSECKALDNEFLTILSTLLKLEESLIPFCQTLHFQYASPEDSTDSSVQKEYLSFLKVLNETHLYAFFRIASRIVAMSFCEPRSCPSLLSS